MVLAAAAAAAAVSNTATAAMSAAVTNAAAGVEESRVTAGWEATRAAELVAPFAGCLAAGARASLEHGTPKICKNLLERKASVGCVGSGRRL